MTCEEMIYSNDFSDFIINYQQDDRESRKIYEGGCINIIKEKIALIHVPRTPEYLTNLESVPYS